MRSPHLPEMLWHGPHHLIRELGKELSHINTATLPSWLQGIENWATSLGGGVVMGPCSFCPSSPKTWKASDQLLEAGALPEKQVLCLAKASCSGFYNLERIGLQACAFLSWFF